MMKRILFIVLLLQAFIGCTATHMITAGRKPDLKAGNSAKLVIIRDAFLGGGVVVWNYVEDKLIGETKGKTYFVTGITPGTHYVSCQSENITLVQMTFKAGNIYYLHQDIWPGAWRANAGLSVMNQNEAIKAMKDCDYWEYDKKNPGENLEKDKYNQAIKDYQIDLKKNPAEYKPFLEYNGYGH